MTKVTPIQFNNPYKFSVYKTGVQTTGTGGFFKVNLDAEVYDSNNNFDATTNFRYVAPVTGYYMFSGGIGYAGSASGNHHIATLYKNGTEVKRGMEGAYGDSSNHNFVVAAQLDLVAGDIIELYGYSLTNYTVIAGTTQTYLQGILLCLT